ncbi:putative serine/threonine-protein kinase YbdM [Paraliobacillus ryukyuensis]|uniref:non-specific serine/threonine protein kinase n=2 Tax=Paraliobacillus ryukyuensis TaxID=200904 RepID=A0A366DYN7_9BACI|nr:serine/threonine-protein kinase [Paraliobacillus ryukyuensis]
MPCLGKPLNHINTLVLCCELILVICYNTTKRKNKEVRMEIIHGLIKKMRQTIMDHHYRIGEKLAGRYIIKKLLQNGSYGIIYLCWDLEANQKCVVKQMRKSKQKESEENYIEETTILAQLDHPAIPKLIETFEYQANHFFAMEFIEGKNIEDALFASKHKYSEKECVELTKKLITIVCYIHNNGVIHGDLRIPNVLLHNGELFVIDFGLAHNLHADEMAKVHQTQLHQEDFFDIGEFLLFLLYSSYQGETKKNRAWTEELHLHPKTTAMLKRLLQINTPYEQCEPILADVDEVLRDMAEDNSAAK